MKDLDLPEALQELEKLYILLIQRDNVLKHLNEL